MAEAPPAPSPLKEGGARPAHSRVNRPVFVGTSAIIIAFVLFAAILPDAAETAIFGSMG